MIYITEYLKGKQDVQQDEYLKCLSEETLEEIFNMGKVDELRELCRECGISNTGQMTKINCIVSLTSAIKSVTDVDKLFFKVWQASGGLLTATCPHGIVYAIKFLLKAESPRDIGDILMSLKHRPNIVISDIPHMLSANTNKRQANFFTPHQGRVVQATDENVKAASEKKLKPVSWSPWLDKRYQTPTAGVTVQGYMHPLTLVTVCYSLYDRFHEGNTKQPKEVLRRCGLVKELNDVNSETAEQVNKFITQSVPFLSLFLPAHHIQIIKSMLATRNYKKNNNIVKRMKSDLKG